MRDLADDVALARAVAEAAAAVPWVAWLGGEAATYGAGETVRGVAIGGSEAEPAISVSFAAEYRKGMDLRALAAEVRRAALRSARAMGVPAARVDVTVHDMIVPAETV